jgi:hypothetical protein
MPSANSPSILKRWNAYAAAVMVHLKALAPYALIELILPGGSMMALLLWLYRRRKLGLGFRQLSATVVLPIGQAFAFQRRGVGDRRCLYRLEPAPQDCTNVLPNTSRRPTRLDD